MENTFLGDLPQKLDEKLDEKYPDQEGITFHEIVRRGDKRTAFIDGWYAAIKCLQEENRIKEPTSNY